MCGSCVTHAEAVLVSAIGAGNVALSLAQRLSDAVHGRTGAERRLAAYQANAAFLRSLGHDPDQILGLPPLHPVRSTARAPRAGALLAT